MTQETYLKDIKEIKDMMEKSSRFISLSGLSGIGVGIIALIASYSIHLYFTNLNYTPNYWLFDISLGDKLGLFSIAVSTILPALFVGIMFTVRKSKRKQLPIWDNQTKRILTELGIPLIIGGIICLVLGFKGMIGLILPFTLFTYGFALLNASKYTFKELRSFGILQLLLAILSFQWIEFSLYFWAIGFGIAHIVYGIIMQLKYK